MCDDLVFSFCWVISLVCLCSAGWHPLSIPTSQLLMGCTGKNEKICPNPNAASTFNVYFHRTLCTMNDELKRHSPSCSDKREKKTFLICAYEAHKITKQNYRMRKYKHQILNPKHCCTESNILLPLAAHNARNILYV